MRYSLGLTGYPLEHSLSPQLHRAALQALELDGDYRLYPVPPLPEGKPELESLLARMRAGELHGLNVTIPHKQAVLELLDELTPTAQAIGAANTIFKQGVRLLGDNTDAAGFLADTKGLLGGPPNIDSRYSDEAWHALLLGTGGAARAVLFALLQDGWRVTVAGRSLENCKLLKNSFQKLAFKDGRIETIRLDKASILNLESEVHLIVNATPVGMWPDVWSSPWPPGVPFPDGARVYDLVYNPAETALLRAARQAGLVVAGGLGMLIEQAALAFRCWTGQDPPRQAMQAAVADFGPTTADVRGLTAEGVT